MGNQWLPDDIRAQLDRKGTLHVSLPGSFRRQTAWEKVRYRETPESRRSRQTEYQTWYIAELLDRIDQGWEVNIFSDPSPGQYPGNIRLQGSEPWRTACWPIYKYALAAVLAHMETRT